MTIELQLILAYLFHRTGDYLLQNSWMAYGKRKNTSIAIAHGLVYVLPFLLLPLNIWQLLIISVTHIVIDRCSLAKRWTELLNGELYTKSSSEWVVPEFVVVEVDQTMHLLINAIAILIGGSGF